MIYIRKITQKKIFSFFVLQKRTPDVHDLIKLDSVNSDEDFDPLLSRSKADGSSLTTNKQLMSQSLNAPMMMGEGLSNPLYPYFEPQKRNSEASTNNFQVGRFYF